VSTDPLPSWADLLALVERLETTDFEDFVVEMPGLTVRVSRHGLAESADAAAVSPASDADLSVTPSTVTESAAADQLAVHPGGTEITAPIVGVFFRRPAPDQAPFVEIGDDVTVGSTLAIVEVMKMMVPVEASVDGRIVAVLAEDGDLVEAEQPLFVVGSGEVT
jgi:acetyl-CoA carboxylase biotin carboxyl carrier protein